MAELYPRIKRPKRLWVAVGINSLVALAALGFLAFISLGSNVPDEVRPTVAFLIRSSGFAISLLAASMAPLFVTGKWRYLILVVATIYFGMIIYQNMTLIIDSYNAFESKVKIKLITNVIHNSTYLAVNYWAILSTKTKLYFDAKDEDS